MRLSALSELVSGVAHELNNPLTAILGYAQIFNSLDGAERDRAVATIEQEAQRAARIVRNLLSFARQEPRQTAPLDLEELLRRVIEARRYSLEVDNIRVVTRFAGVPEVVADAGQFESVFLNLIDNAQRALQPGGGEVVIATSITDRHVRISVADNGPSITEADRERIFEPFFTTQTVGAGQGLGLSRVYGVVSEHGGRVWVEPAPLGGASFVIELPLERTLPPRPAPPPGGSERVLVVDDEAPIRALTSEILGAAGYHVATAASGDEALRLLESAAFDVVIADMRMPGLDGAARYERIGERWPLLQQHMLFITGDAEGERTNRRLARGDIRYLEKPFDTSALLRAVRDVADRVQRRPG
ncbi:MAG: hybrid sensor histidine kinase/response regulator [Dehalococcoidia bacterium]|nr:hybrid sensor histidine kinase/response regulator [Dehalococcoidia bacterium]